MAKKGFERICDAINTIYAARSGVEFHGVMNAFRMAIREQTNVMVLMKTVEHNGKEYKTFMLMSDSTNETIFPLFTDITELNAVSSDFEIQTGMRLSTHIMELGELIQTLVDKKICDRVVVNPKSLDFDLYVAFYDDVLNQEATSHITLINADITKMHTDAIVGSVYENGEIMEESIRKAIGDHYKDEIAEFKPNVSDVLETPLEGKACSSEILFTRPPIYTNENDINGLYTCYYNCLTVAKGAEFSSIAFPCIGAQNDAIPLDIVIAVSTAAALDWLRNNSDYVIDIYFCCEDEATKNGYQAFFDNYLSNA